MVGLAPSEIATLQHNRLSNVCSVCLSLWGNANLGLQYVDGAVSYFRLHGFNDGSSTSCQLYSIGPFVAI